MTFKNRVAGLVFLFCCFNVGTSQWLGHTYWNGRYEAIVPDWVSYTDVDTRNALWSDEGSLAGPYLIPNGEFNGDVCSCTCDDSVSDDEHVKNCGGGAITLKNQAFHNMTPEAFTNPGAVTTITILNCVNFDLFVNDTFKQLTSLTEVLMQKNSIVTFPDLSASSLEILNLAKNKLKLSTANYQSVQLPGTLTHVTLAENEIYWLPPGMFSNTNIKFLNLANNEIDYFPQDALKNMPELLYLGLDGNNLKSVSVANLGVLKDSKLQHLNLSNNDIFFIEKNALAQLQDLKVLELHQNKFVNIPVETIDNIPLLAHLDMNNNELETLTTKSFTNLPELITLRLHTQTTAMKAIAYDAFQNIGAKLRYLWVSDNALTSFPHAALADGAYPAIDTIWADTNGISDLIEFGREAFPTYMSGYYEQRKNNYVPFSTIANLKTLYVHSNQISQIRDTDLCELVAILNLYADANKLSEANIDEEAFTCIPTLEFLSINSNLCQYVPVAVKTADKMPSIETLNIASNKLTFLLEDTFSNLTTLRVLNLDSNSIISIEDGTFPDGLQDLALSSNDFRFLHENPFTNLSDLRNLELSNNEIEVLPDDAFHGMTSLNRLTLDGNKLKRIMKTHFKDVPFGDDLYLQNNEIVYIQDGTFAHVTNFVELDLSNNLLVRIPNDGDFNSLTVADDFSLTNNRIVEIPEGAFDTLNVKNLYLQKNRISVIMPNAFKDLTMSQDLNLRENPLKRLSEKSFNNVNVRNLFMDGMDLTEIPSRAFFDLTTSQSLYLEGNQIDTIQVAAFCPISIGKHLFLSGNGLSTLAGAIFCASSSISEWTDLNDNELKILPTDAFQDVTMRDLNMNDNELFTYPSSALSNLNLQKILMARNELGDVAMGSFTSGNNAMQEMDLSDNDIEDLKAGLLDELVNLKKLLWSGNNVKRIEAGVFDQNTKLEVINLQGNQLPWFPKLPSSTKLKNIYLANNQIQAFGQNAFDDNTALTEIQLGGNPIGCDCNTYYTLGSLNDTNIVDQADCNKPTDLNGYMFDDADKNDAQFYQNAAATKYQCSGYNITATPTTSGGSAAIEVAWDAPFQLNPDSSAPYSTWTYEVTCEGDSVATVNKTLADSSDFTSAPRSTTTLSLTAADGVVANKEYVCSVTLETAGYTSAPSPPMYVITNALSATNAAGPLDYELQMWNYDFSVYHPDFSGYSKSYYTDPQHVWSPYGAWLKVSDNPSSDTFTSWYRDDSSVNQVYQSTIILENQAGAAVPTHRFWQSDFFPLETGGYLHQGQKDCNGELRNLGFTTAVRAGFKFEGQGSVSIAGGDETWLYIDNVYVLEVLTDPANVSIPCKKFDITPAVTGGVITPYEGTIVGDTCVATDPLIGEQFTLNLTVGDTYHFDLFSAERFGCKSNFFIETEYLNFDSSDPPMDYFEEMSESFHTDGIVATMELTDFYSVGPNFDIDVTSGNEARHFTVKADTAGNQAAGVAPAAVAPTYTYLPGVDPFIECPVPATVTPDGNNAAVESFTVSTTTALLTLATTVDFEVAQRYVVVMQVEDTGTTPVTTGQIVVRVNILDDNDNCPILTPDTSYEFEPIPALEMDPIIQVNATDADSTNNGEIVYYASTPTVVPALSRYDISMDLWDMIFEENSTLNFYIIAMDNGTPRRGDKTEVNLTLSNTCLLDVLLQEIELQLPIGMTNDSVIYSGDVYFRVPKYYVVDYACDRTDYMKQGFILDDKVTASSFIDVGYPGRGRVNETYDPIGKLFGAWVAETLDTNQYLEVDLSDPYKFKGFILQHREEQEEWVTSFRLLYSDDGVVFNTYTHSNGTMDFPADFTNLYGTEETLTYELDPPILARYIRINPRSWHNWISMRVDFIGCTQEEQHYYDTTCSRCETSWYCLGDGIQMPCGRCDPPVEGSTCNRSATEHSFGAASECTPCHDGWICHDGYGSPCGQYEYANCTADSCPETCSVCENGYACRSGIRFECPAGTYSEEPIDYCTMCDPGTYQNETGQDHCLNCAAGYYTSKMKDRCNPCPDYTYSLGDGTICQDCTSGSDCACLATPYPCFKGSKCYNSGSDGTSHICDSCPDGYQGDGVTCADIDECTVYNPCFQGRCVNTQPGYQCQHCPEGYLGTFEDAIGPNITNRVYTYCNGEYSLLQVQNCSDVDECAADNGGCDANAFCHNTVGSYSCGFCKKGYLGDAFYGCYSDNYCAINKHNCGSDASCTYAGPGIFRCECNDGYAGNGKRCGLDPDLDGHPTIAIQCADFGCYRDNCPGIPNSGQEDNDNDYIGDFCDPDDDNDNVADDVDNCQYVSNFYQTDTDGDGVGDDCDNCVDDANADQLDTDNDGAGNECDSDDDGDGIADGADNCPLVATTGAEADADGDGIGNICDNCPNDANADQADADQNGYGDVCDTPGANNQDRDGDGVLDDFDNCPTNPNPSQSDIDGDGTGDLCDDDIDGDTLLNSDDNCPYVSNVAQTDANGNQIGDDCETDTDGDGVTDESDHCPRNPSINSTELWPYTWVKLDSTSADADPIWELGHDGSEIRQLKDISMPVMLLGPQSYSGIDYSGTWFVNSNEGQDYVGFVFGYQSNRKFYVVMWRHENYNYKTTTYVGGIKGIHIKAVESSTGPGVDLAKAIWNSHDTANQVRILWQEPTMQGWQHKTPYRWHLQFRPSLGLMRLRVVKETQTIFESGDIYDTSFHGGKIGVMSFGQVMPSWSHLVARCIDRENQALQFDGVDDFVKIANISELKINESFTAEAWVKLPDSYPMTKLPIMCTQDGTLCMYIHLGHFGAQIGEQVAKATTVLEAGYWHHLVMRFDAQDYKLSLFINGTGAGFVAENTNAKPAGWNEDNDALIYMGTDGSNYFTGKLDELRVYEIWLDDDEINDHLEFSGLDWQKHSKYLSAHFDMNEDPGNSILPDYGIYSLDGTMSGDPTFVDSTHDHGRFHLSYPNSRR